jgi:hypothetical protein
MLESWRWGTYIFFCVWTILGGLFVYFCLPETKGKTLEEMDTVFGSHTTAEDMAELARIQGEVGLTALTNRVAGLVDLKGEKVSENTHMEEI